MRHNEQSLQCVTSLTIDYSTVYSGADQRKQSSASLAFVRRIHRWPVNSTHKGPVTRKMFPFHDVIMMGIEPLGIIFREISMGLIALDHYTDVIMTTIASQITSLTVVYSTVYSGADQRKQNSASLAFVRRIHRWPVNSTHEGPVTRKMFPFDDVIMMGIEPLGIIFREISMGLIALDEELPWYPCLWQMLQYNEDIDTIVACPPIRGLFNFTSDFLHSSHPSLHISMCWHIDRYNHDAVIKWKHFPRYWPFVRGIHRSPVKSPHKGQWRGALMIFFICAWINVWVNDREAGGLRRHRAHYDVTVMIFAISQPSF